MAFLQGFADFPMVAEWIDDASEAPAVFFVDGPDFGGSVILGHVDKGYINDEGEGESWVGRSPPLRRFNE